MGLLFSPVHRKFPTSVKFPNNFLTGKKNWRGRGATARCHTPLICAGRFAIFMWISGAQSIWLAGRFSYKCRWRCRRGSSCRRHRQSVPRLWWRVRRRSPDCSSISPGWSDRRGFLPLYISNNSILFLSWLIHVRPVERGRVEGERRS